MSPKSSRKIIITHKHNLNKVRSIINSKNPEVLILESDNPSLNLKTNSTAYKLVMDDSWEIREMKSTTKRNPEERKLLKVTLIKSSNTGFGG